MTGPGHHMERVGLGELVRRLAGTAEALTRAARLPEEVFDGSAATAFRRRALRCADAAAGAARAVGALAGTEHLVDGTPSATTGAGAPGHPPPLPPGARSRGADTRPPAVRRPRLPEVDDGPS